MQKMLFPLRKWRIRHKNHADNTSFLGNRRVWLFVILTSKSNAAIAKKYCVSLKESLLWVRQNTKLWRWNTWSLFFLHEMLNIFWWRILYMSKSWNYWRASKIAENIFCENFWIFCFWFWVILEQKIVVEITPIMSTHQNDQVNIYFDRWDP